jgi:hypothetical protein
MQRANPMIIQYYVREGVSRIIGLTLIDPADKSTVFPYRCVDRESQFETFNGFDDMFHVG